MEQFETITQQGALDNGVESRRGRRDGEEKPSRNDNPGDDATTGHFSEPYNPYRPGGIRHSLNGHFDPGVFRDANGLADSLRSRNNFPRSQGVSVAFP
jgi:hypothetical protein